MTDPVVRLRGQVVQRPKEQVGLPGGIVDWFVIRPKEQVGLPGGIVDWLVIRPIEQVGLPVGLWIGWIVDSLDSLVQRPQGAGRTS